MCHLFCRTGFVLYSLLCSASSAKDRLFPPCTRPNNRSLWELKAKRGLVGGEISLEWENLLSCPESTTDSFDQTRQDFSCLDTWNKQKCLMDTFCLPSLQESRYTLYSRESIKLQKGTFQCFEHLRKECSVWTAKDSLTFLPHTHHS